MSVKYMAVMLRSFYFFTCGCGGVFYFLSVWLKGRGLNFEEIGLIMSMTALSKILFGPVAASLSDRGINSCRIMIILSVVSLTGTAILLPHTNVMIYMLAVLLARGGMTSCTPLGETLTLAAIKKRTVKGNYSQIRVYGTFSYAFFAVLTGYLIKKYEDIPDIAIYVALFCGLALPVVVMNLKDIRNLNEIKNKPAKLKLLFKQKDFILVTLIQILYYSSFGMQNGIGPAHWISVGIDANVVGLLTVPTIFSEAIFFLAAKKYFDGIPYQTMFLLSASTTMIRWLILGISSNPYIIGCAFLLHGINFCCIHLGTMTYIKDVIAENLTARAQVTYAVFADGICSGMAMLLFGLIYPYLCERCFFVSAGMMFVAMVLAFRLRKRNIHTIAAKKEGR